jgi:N-acetylgalactosamine kinase
MALSSAAGHAGAGWGGCIVALVREQQVQAFTEQLRQQYYLPRVQAGLLQAEQVAACCFMSTPAAGARVWRSS